MPLASRLPLGTRLSLGDESRTSPLVLAEGRTHRVPGAALVSPSDLTLAGRRCSSLNNSHSETKLRITATLNQGSCRQPVAWQMGESGRSKAGFLIDGSECGLAFKFSSNQFEFSPGDLS